MMMMSSDGDCVDIIVDYYYIAIMIILPLHMPRLPCIGVDDDDIVSDSVMMV